MSRSRKRLVAKHLGERLNQPIVVENKAGASGNIGTAEVAMAPPEGYALLLSSGPWSLITGPVWWSTCCAALRAMRR
jgi:tripartite-type tricarboxylate transporter receptor subunit TctC